MPLSLSTSAPAPTMLTPSETSTPRTLTKIVATIGPASESPDAVRRLIAAGVSVFRFNFSHGDFVGHGARLATVRRVAEELGTPVAVLGDLQGPKIRVGRIPESLGEAARSGGGTIVVAPGQDLVLKRGIREAFERENVHAPAGTREPVLPVTYDALVDEVQVGHRVLINDGAIRMIAVDRSPDTGELRCRVTTGGAITTGKGINLPQSDIAAPAITARDWECVAWAVQNEFDYLALSFVRRAAEVHELRARLNDLCAKAPRRGGLDLWISIVSKIEKPQALSDLESIVDASEGVMVARGDLGVEMEIAQVPVAQKRIISCCAARGRPCIVATQMLETMIENSTPTRAEASDVANAVFDGADAVMLSAETATGKHPALVVDTMARIVAAAEASVTQADSSAQPPSTYAPEHAQSVALAHGAWHIARDLHAKVVACWSEQGGNARYLSQNNFHIPIIAFSSDPRAARRMALYGSVWPVCRQPPADRSLQSWNREVEELLLARGLVQVGDWIVLLAGRPLGQAKATNAIAVQQVGRPVAMHPAH